MEYIFIDYFHKHGESCLPFLVNGKISSKVLLSAYNRLPPIEEMPPHEKSEMKKFVIDLFPEKIPQEKVTACKIIYTIGNLI